MVQYARYETKHAPLNTDFAAQLALKWFGQEVIDQLPRYVRGPKKGQVKAWLCWYKVMEGGWSRELGGVLYPGVSRAWITGTFGGEEATALRLDWCGRVQAVCGSKAVLTAEYRAQAIAERLASCARDAAFAERLQTLGIP